MKYYNLHTHQLPEDDDVIALVNQYPWEFDDTVKLYSIGIHPWYIEKNRIESDFTFIENKLQLNPCKAIGECGLDNRISVPLQLQEEVFRRHITLAKTYKKPMVLHLVAAYQELLELYHETSPNVPIILHGFSKNKQVAKSMLDAGFYLSFGKYLLRNPDLETVFNYVPNDRFFLETDTVEESIQEVYQKAASVKKIPLEYLKEIVAKTWNKVMI